MAKRAYSIIGGPLDGKYALMSDFYKPFTSARPEWSTPGGCYERYAKEYSTFNSAGSARCPTSMVFVHNSLLKPPITAHKLEEARLDGESV